MKKYIIILFFIFFYGVCFAQNAPKIEFKVENNTIDYGIIVKDKDSGIRTFEFSNTGNAPLIIYSIQSTTHCTILKQPTEPVLPGKSSQIEIKYTMVEGPIRKTITVETNASNYPEGRIPLKIKGEVVLN